MSNQLREDTSQHALFIYTAYIACPTGLQVMCPLSAGHNISTGEKCSGETHTVAIQHILCGDAMKQLLELLILSCSLLDPS